MGTRIATVAAAATLAVVPLLGGCGSAAAPAGSSAPPASAPATPSTAAEATPAAGAATPAVTPSADPTEAKAVQAATRTFVRAVLTVGYPDKTFGAYTARIEPLMTKEGFASFETADSVKKGSAALATLYAQHARSAPRLDADPQVVSLAGGKATATMAYENQAQRKQGDGWKTLKSLGTGSVTVTFVEDHGKWLVEGAR